MPMLASVEVAEILVSGCHGVLEVEKKEPQPFAVSITALVDISEAVSTDNLKSTLDYSSLTEIVKTIVTVNSFDLLERLCYEIAAKLMKEFSPYSLTVKVKKLKPLMDADVQYAAVELTLQGDKRP